MHGRLGRSFKTPYRARNLAFLGRCRRTAARKAPSTANGMGNGSRVGQVLSNLHTPAKSKRGREEGDGTENVINCRDVCRKLS